VHWTATCVLDSHMCTGWPHVHWAATCALDSKMPFEALYRTPPDLLEAHLWGCKAWVHNDTGSKLSICTCEGQWIGFDLDLWAHRIYWPKSDSVCVKRNVYFTSAAQLEGEEFWVPTVSSELTATLDTPISSKSYSTSIPSSEPSAPKQIQEPDNLPVQLC